MAKKILIVDDDSQDLEVMKKLLENSDFFVTTAKNGAEALDMLDYDKFDLILIDIILPTLSGYDLLRLAREKFNHGMKILFVSVVKKNEVDFKDVDGFIQKPINKTEFIKTIKKVLK